MYKILPQHYYNAKVLGVEIKPSTLKNKKIDVYKDNKKIAAIGDVRYKDYEMYILEKGQLDMVVERKDLRKIISTIISQLTNKNKVFISDSNFINIQQQSPLGSIGSVDPISKATS